jgi:hypothetical protein
VACNSIVWSKVDAAEEISTSVVYLEHWRSIMRASLSGSQSYVVLKAIMAFWVLLTDCGSLALPSCNPGMV